MAAPEKSFLGTGWAFPPAFSRESLGARMVSDEEDIHESLRILLATSLGERVMVPTFGVGIRELLFQALTKSLMTQIKTMIGQAILNWEPRITVTAIGVKADPAVPGLVRVSIDYVVRKTNTRSNFVYPFYAEEATLASRGP